MTLVYSKEKELYMKYNASNTALRYAIWTAYGCKCAYTHQPIKYHEMEIDHFIPKDMVNKPEELKLLLKEVGVNENFDINSILNCLPAKKPVNNSKSNTPFDSHNTRYYLNYINERIEKVKLIYKKFMDCDKNAKAMAQLNAAIRKGNEKLENIVNNVKGESSHFELCDYENDYDNSSFTNYHVVNKNYERVGININLPSKRNIFGYCSIAFKSLAVRDCFITFSHQDILNILFSGIYSDYCECQRGFIDHKKPNDNMYFIQFKGLSFYLSEEDTKQLCDLVDDIYPKYINKLRELEKFHGISKFTLSKKDGRVRLFRVKRSLYKKILEFGNRYDYSSGDSDWHIFNSSPYNIVPVNRNAGYEEPDFHAFLHPAIQESILGPLDESDEVWVEWSISNRQLMKTKYEYSQDGLWDAETTYEWLTSRVIPRVFFEKHMNDNNKMFKRKISFNEFSENFNTDNYIITNHVQIIETNMNWSLEKLYNLIEKLQLHYSIIRYCWFSKKSVSELYATFAKLVSNCGNSISGYAKSHLSYIDNIDEEPYESILEYSKSINKDGIETSRLETFFRSYLEILRSVSKINRSLMLEVIESLKPFIEKYNDKILIKKHLDK